MNENIMIKNLCKWDLYFNRINGTGDVKIPAKTSFRIDRGEVFAQVQSGNVMFSGTDGKGNHARIYIDDKETRVELGFEDDKENQGIITEEKIKTIFATKGKSSFEKAVKSLAVTYAEKAILIDYAKKSGLNEYDKIKFIEEYTGMKIE
jgi:hypothetical protein